MKRLKYGNRKTEYARSDRQVATETSKSLSGRICCSSESVNLVNCEVNLYEYGKYDLDF